MNISTGWQPDSHSFLAALAERCRALASRPRLQLIEPIDERVYQRYDFVPVDLYKNRFQTPHMVVQMGETVFTTVMLFLQKT